MLLKFNPSVPNIGHLARFTLPSQRFAYLRNSLTVNSILCHGNICSACILRSNGFIFLYPVYLENRCLGNAGIHTRQLRSTVSLSQYLTPVAVAERSKACTVFARSEAGIVGSNPTKGTDVWHVYVFSLCLCCPVFR
jgi:hypothetical protein